MQGRLKKLVEKVKMFQYTIYPERYFVIDFTSAIIYIKHDENVPSKSSDLKNPKLKIIPFRSIKDCHLPHSSSGLPTLPNMP